MWRAWKRLRCPKKILYDNLAYVRTACGYCCIISRLKGAASTPEERPSAAGDRLAKEVKGPRGGRHLFTFHRVHSDPFYDVADIRLGVLSGPPSARRRRFLHPLALRLLKATDGALLSAVWQRRWERKKRKKKNQSLWLERLVLETCSLFPKSFQWRYFSYKSTRKTLSWSYTPTLPKEISNNGSKNDQNTRNRKQKHPQGIKFAKWSGTRAELWQEIEIIM